MFEDARFQVRPLYLQVRNALIERIKDGRWKPGCSLPSEVDLHRQFGVSLGTLRRALEVLESEQLIIRNPGRGTSVRDCQAGRPLARFNPMRGPDGAPLRGEVKISKFGLASPTSAERTALALGAGDQVVRIDRTRFHNQRPFAYEQAVLPKSRFPGLADLTEVPDDLEELAQVWGVFVVRATAKVRITGAPPAAAAALSLPDGTALLSLRRIAFDTDDQPIEAMTAYYDVREEYCALELR